MKNRPNLNLSFIDAQDTLNQTMCQAQAVISALTGDDQFKHMRSDHVVSLLFLTHQHFEQLNDSYNRLLSAAKNGGA